jgi:hypothetical protein
VFARFGLAHKSAHAIDNPMTKIIPPTGAQVEGGQIAALRIECAPSIQTQGVFHPFHKQA